uniref:Dynamin-binding protein n=2 Tax=Parascaris univalens TaxID=6257 RepID=A0A915CGC2_PARUN
MIEAPCYVRVLKTHRGTLTEVDTSVDEDEIIYVVADEGTERFGGYRLFGEKVSVHKENVCCLELPDMRPTELFFVASIADYDSDAISDISFGKYTVIAVSKELDSTWYEGVVIGHNGKRLGKAGCFPKSFVVRLDHVPIQDKRGEESRSDRSQMRALSCADFASEHLNEVLYDEPPESCTSTNSTLPTNVVFREKPLSAMIGAQTYAPEGAYALSIYPFQGKNVSELSFEENRIITVRRYVDEQWVEGELDGKMGIFPASFVRMIVDLPIAMHPSEFPKSHENDIGMASALFSFTARHNDELSVSEGESVSIVKMINDEWAYCFNPASGRSGIVPLSFLHLYANEENEKESSEDVDTKYCASDGSSELVPALDEHDESALPATTLDADQLDAFFGFSSGWSVQTAPNTGSLIGENTIAGDEERKKPPPRPPPPKLSAVRLRSDEAGRMAPPRPTSLPTCPAALKTSFQLTGVGIDAETTKRRIVEDLIVSELQYLSDIGMWEAEIDNSNALSREHKAIFTNGIPELKDLSRRLVAQLTQQQGRPFELQCYGHAFMQMREDFRTTFALHFRCVEAANMLLETEEIVKNALNECVAEMRALGSNVFDAYTAVSRPVQRCLKYPLFIEQLIKNTPISHMDHPKLLEALRQMSFLASTMNESKRRKELAQKYKEADQEGFSKRLSRLNMHTVKKKSTRFKYRLSNQIGLVHMQRDAVFDSVVENLDASERRVCAFLHSVQLYMRLISTQTRRYVDSHTTREKLSNHPDSMTAEIRGFCGNLLRETSSLSSSLDTTVIREAKKFLRLPVTRMIQKRYDKLIDFESAKRSDKNVDNLRVKQGDYEALNKQLKMTLPRIVDNLNARTFTLVDSVVSKDSQFFATIAQLYEQLHPEVRSFFVVPYRRFVDPYERRLNSLIAIGRLAKETQSSKVPLNSATRASSADLRKESLIEVPQGGYAASAAAHATKAEDGESPFLSDSKHLNASQSSPPQPEAVSVKMAEPDLIDLEENLLDLSSPVKTQSSSTLPIATSSSPFDILQETPPTMLSSKNPFLGDSFHHDISAMQSSSVAKESKYSKCETMRLDSSDAIFGSLFEDAKTMHLSAVGKRTDSPLGKPLIPLRPTEEDMHAANNQSNERLEGYSQHLPYDAVSSAYDFEQTELFKADYDFEGADDIQLSIVEGEKLNVLRRSDDEGNSAWWMVQNEEGIVGYVPANYLSPFSGSSSHQ